MPRPTITDVAPAAGVSKGAVSFALNDRPGLAPETRGRILETAEAMGWTPSSRARALSVSQCAGCRPGRSPGRQRPCVRTRSSRRSSPAWRACWPTRGTRSCCSSAERDDAAAYRRLAEEGRVDGVFVTDLHVDDPRPALLEELGLPAVIVGPAPRRAACPPPRGRGRRTRHPRGRRAPHRARPHPDRARRWAAHDGARPLAARGWATRLETPGCPRALRGGRLLRRVGSRRDPQLLDLPEPPTASSTPTT